VARGQDDKFKNGVLRQGAHLHDIRLYAAFAGISVRIINWSAHERQGHQGRYTYHIRAQEEGMVRSRWESEQRATAAVIEVKVVRTEPAD
jgi:hypothetical protein